MRYGFNYFWTITMSLTIFLIFFFKLCMVQQFNALRQLENGNVSNNTEILVEIPYARKFNSEKIMKQANYNLQMMKILRKKRLKTSRNYGDKYYKSVKAFEGFNNKIGLVLPIIPNIVHFLSIGEQKLSYAMAICIRAAYANQVPEKIFIHSDVRDFQGYHWKLIETNEHLIKTIEIVNVEVPKEINGHNLTDTKIIRNYMKLKILKEYGGIFADNDMYVVNNLDKYLKYELVMPWKGKGFPLSDTLIIAHKRSRLINAWLDHYNKNYEPTFQPLEFAAALLEKNPDLIHKEFKKFVVEPRMLSNIYLRHWPAWKFKDAIWLMAELRKNRIKTELPENDEGFDSSTFGELAGNVF